MFFSLLVGASSHALNSCQIGRLLCNDRAPTCCRAGHHGFCSDFGWIQLPVFGPEGYPEHRRGIIATVPGLGFLGLRYQ